MSLALAGDFKCVEITLGIQPEKNKGKKELKSKSVNSKTNKQTNKYRGVGCSWFEAGMDRAQSNLV